MKMGKNTWVIILIIVVLIVMVGGWFLLKGRPQPVAPAPTPPAVTPSPEVTPPPEGEAPTPGFPPAGVRELTVSGTEFSFSPDSIKVISGERVRITFRNNGGAPHNLTIGGLGVATRTIGSGQTDTVEFTAPASGTYTFFCSVSGHRAAGMEGQLKVE